VLIIGVETTKSIMMMLFLLQRYLARKVQILLR